MPTKVEKQNFIDGANEAIKQGVSFDEYCSLLQQTLGPFNPGVDVRTMLVHYEIDKLFEGATDESAEPGP